MKSLNEDLKTGNIKQAYLLYGELCDCSTG